MQLTAVTARDFRELYGRAESDRELSRHTAVTEQVRPVRGDIDDDLLIRQQCLLAKRG